MSEKCQKIFEEILTLVPINKFSEIKKRDGRLRFPIYLNERMRETAITDLELTTRSNNCLHRAGYHTIGDLVDAVETLDDLKKIRNCGAKSIKEIMERLFCYQYEQLEPSQKLKYIQNMIELN